MFIEERHQEIIKIIEKEGRIKATDIQERFQIGFDTARRDLRILEEKGLLKRTRGGAIPIPQIGSKAPKNYCINNIKEIKDNYLAIARKAVTYIKNNDVIFLTCASIGYFMTKLMPTNINFTVVTNSVFIAEELRNYQNITLYVMGGLMNHKGQIIDSFDLIRNMRFDINFMTSAKFSASFGMSIQTCEAMQSMKAVIESSTYNIALFPHEKIGFDSIIKVCPADAFQMLITDWETSEEDIKEFEHLGIDVIVVERN